MNFNDVNNEEIIHKIPIKYIIILIDEFNYPNNDETYKNLLTYLDAIREHNIVITFIISNELHLHENKRCKSLFWDGRIGVKLFFNYCTTNQLQKMLKYFLKKLWNWEYLRCLTLNVIKYFIKGYTGEEIISLLKTEKQEKRRNTWKNLFYRKFYKNKIPRIINKRVKEEKKLNNMSEKEKEKEIYFKRKNENRERRRMKYI